MSTFSTHILRGCFISTGVIAYLPQFQWSNSEGYGLAQNHNSQQQSANCVLDIEMYHDDVIKRHQRLHVMAICEADHRWIPLTKGQ